MSAYHLWRKGRGKPLALITHDRQVQKVFGSNPAEDIEYLLDNPSEVALRECYVTCEVLERKW